MNEFTQLNHEFASDIVRPRETRRAVARNVAPHRRTARRSLAVGLHRLADRLDG